MKKLLIAVAVAGGIAVLLRQYRKSSEAGADLWAEATDVV